ncbi:protein of unknown function [Microbacterium sp. Nx66]|nr:protein of unknown function [Microbacterium sp. Nx66]
MTRSPRAALTVTTLCARAEDRCPSAQGRALRHRGSHTENRLFHVKHSFEIATTEGYLLHYRMRHGKRSEIVSGRRRRVR